MTADQLDTYPHDLMGGPARPPATPRHTVVNMARDAQRRQLAAIGLVPPERVWEGVAWQLAPSLVVLRDEANATNPSRDKASDGTIGDARHQAEGNASDHNPWLVWNGVPWVRAEDLDTDGLDLPAAFEAARAKAAAGQLPQVVGGGYLILNGRITAPDFSEWRAYKGTDPHVLHGHVSVSTDPGRFTSRDPWGIFGGPTPPPPAPAPAPAPPAPAPTGWPGPDLVGVGLDLRGDQGNSGQRVANLQDFFRRTYSLYAKGLAVDGWWGPATTAVIREFAQRSGIRSADGLNIGPQIARKLYVAGARP